MKLLICCLHIRRTSIAILFLLIMLAGSATAQQTPNTDPKKEQPLNELLSLRGKLLAERNTDQATGNPKIVGYRVEELQLPRSVNVELHGQQVSVNRAWRITLNGGPFSVRALPAVIWIDDQIVGYGIENETLSQIRVVTFDSSLIREGAVISLSYGEDKDARQEFSQRLHLKREGENQ
jgi:hypothetical protein